jgi:hypothetical protein
MSKKEFKKGDLVIHAVGTTHPHKYLQGVIVKDDFDWVGGQAVRVFWYTTARYQNISALCLSHLDNSLT